MPVQSCDEQKVNSATELEHEVKSLTLTLSDRNEEIDSGTEPYTYNKEDMLLSKKKQEYLQQQILDKTGTYNYVEDPQGYKKARK